MIVELPEELTIAQAAALKARLLAAVAGAPGQEEVLLDGRKVTAADVTGLQLLIAAWESAAARGRKVGFAPGARSKVLDAAAETAGLVRALAAPKLPADPWEEVRHG
jgi:UDP-N-acetyl-D-mannosaminuronic acid transferase (WecB/TagA/CpsF family)